ncbi:MULTISPECIES: hypothetical protein [unclassified Mucilaginibacter]|uniref:hypothetical protein n=1 Tax=unclassified Mucilaginibacter TaxID=2617802 RepID=UPI002AC93370|nr:MULTISPECIES: hypothetical protein [unclassified Mucilaginibacter]MEB0260992.1 hypothetical protein [Mucilaginibacter sp. 10I4]MEB0279587.1 hypothetical protein [Mucilaginibacter sp. 10B2]MEB0300350.1 hypothetical protein [Mucilaginibacter sp. 5C4]WPX22545.1 hypothetical protein RHM67_14785 [Mucilaginibacter sp. 5C4]
MVEVFDTYTKKNKLYYTLQTVSILTIIFLVVAKIINLKLPLKFPPYLIALFGICLTLIVVNMILTGTNLIKMYVKDGEISMSTKSITFKSLTIPITDIKKIEINANDFRGARSSDGSGNQIKIYGCSNEIFQSRFVINSMTQRDNLRQILNKLNINGVKIVLDDISLKEG